MAGDPRRDAGGIGKETDAAAYATPASPVAEGNSGYRLLFETGTDGMLLADAEEKIVDANPSACRLLDRRREELMGTSLWGVFDPSYPIFEAARGTDRGETFRAGAPLLRGDGTSLPAEIWISWQTEGGLGVVFRAVTERRNADEKLRESEESFDALVKNALDMTTICNADNTIRYISPSVKGILGYDPDELVGEFVPGLIHPDDLELSARESAAILANPEHEPAPIRYRHKDGSWVYLESVVNNLTGDPDVRGIVLNSHDVTERVRLEEALREREERFRALVENGLDLIVLVDLDNTISYISPSIRRILGYEPEELVGVFVPDLLHPDDKEPAARESAKMLASPVYQGPPFRHRHKDGSWRYLQGVFNNKVDDPNVGGIVANMRDVTDRVMAERALKESEERFRALVENAQDIIAVCDPDNTIRSVSPAVERVLGYAPEELAGVFVSELLHPDELERAAEVVERVNRTPGPCEPVTYRYRHKDGSWVYLESIFTNLLEEPSVGAVVANSRDVTGRVRQEEEIRRLNEELERRVEERTAQLRSAMEEAEGNAEMLRLSEERFRSLVQHASDIITLLDPDGTIRYESPAIERTLGYGPDELIGKDVFDFIHPDDLGRLGQTMRRILESRGVQTTLQLRFRHKDGSWRYLESVANNLTHEPGVGGIVVNSRDVTERREAEVRYRTLVEQIPAVTYIQETEHDRLVYVSPQIEEILGYSPERYLEEPDLRTQTIHPDDRWWVLAEDERTNRTGEPYTVEYRKRRADGETIWVRDEAVLVRDAEGGPLFWQGLLTDVTERKRSEEELRRSLGVLLALYEAGQILTSTMDFDERGERLLEIMRRTPGLAAAVISLRGEDGELRTWKGVGPEETWVPAREAPEAERARRAVLAGVRQEAYRSENLEAPPVGICVPMRAAAGLVGTLEAFGSEALGRVETVEALKSLADQAGGALENARLYADLAERERRLEELVGKLIVAQEEERRNVAYDLHDGLTQVAVATHNLLQAFADDHPPGSTVEEGSLDRILELAQQTVFEARRVIADLRPTILDDFGLAAAVRQLVSELRAEPRSVEYTETLGNERLPAAEETALYRVAQEALTNARKHAGKDAPVRVTLGREDSRVRLEVRDFGRGFDPERAVSGGGPGERIGLSSMRERVALLGGELSIEGRPGEGATVVAEVPLSDGEGSEGNGGD